MSALQPATQWDALAFDCERAKALLVAGLPSTVAWSQVFEEHASDGDHVPNTRAKTAPDRALVGAAWAASVEIGAPLSVTMTLLAQTYRALAGIEREVESAVAGPRIATRVMLTLPAISVILAGGLGMNILSFFFGNAFGALCLFSGAVLTGIGWWWSRRMVGHIATNDVPREIDATVIVAGLRVGVGVQTTMEALRRRPEFVASTDGVKRVQRLEAMSATWGVPLADLLLSEVQQSRDAAVARVRRQCAELAERLLIPLGACVLPAFVLLGVVPIVVELITTSGLAVGWSAGWSAAGISESAVLGRSS